MQEFTEIQIKKMTHLGIDKSAFKAYYNVYLTETAASKDANKEYSKTFDEYLDRRIKLHYLRTA